MAKKLIFSFFLFSQILCSQNRSVSSSAIEIPYYLPFETWIDESEPDSDCTENWCEEEETGSRIDITNIDDYYGNSLKIKVQSGDSVNCSGYCDRAEIKMKDGHHPLYINATTYYSYDVFFPKNGTFEDEERLPGMWYNIMQWHPDIDGIATHCYKPRPPLRIEYIGEEFDGVGQVDDDYRDLWLTYGTNYNGECAVDNCLADEFWKGKKTVKIIDAIKKGEWNQLIFQIKWSHDGDDAFIRMWVNQKPVVNPNVNSTISDCSGGDNNLKVGTSGQTPFDIDGLPLLYTKDGVTNPDNNDIIQNRLKIGHYRSNLNQNTNKYFIDNFRITKKFPPAPFRTHLTNKFCDKELKDDYKLKAYELKPSNTYKFEFKEGLNTYYYNSSVPEVDLLDRTWALENKTYDVRVKVVNDLNGGDGFSYGRVCQIITPKETQLSEEYCGNLNLFHSIYSNAYIECDPIIGATNYKFRIVEGSNTHYYNSPTNVINLSSTQWFQYNQQYTVYVSVQTQNNPLGYSEGDSCNFKFIYGGFSNLQQSDNNDTLDILLLPNPTSGYITLSLSNEDIKINKITLYRFDGSIVKVINKNVETISLQDQNKGIYFLRIHTEKGTIIKRIIKN